MAMGIQYQICILIVQMLAIKVCSGIASMQIYQIIALEDVNVTGGNLVGGLVGHVTFATTSSCYVTGSVTANDTVGGLVGYIKFDLMITNCYTTTSVAGFSSGGLVGCGFSNVTLGNAYFTGTTGESNGIGSGTPKSGTATKVTMTELDELIAQGVLPVYQGYVPPTPTTGGGLILQVGVNANDSSQIGFTLQGIDLSGLNNLDLQNDKVFETLDSILAKIND